MSVKNSQYWILATPEPERGKDEVLDSLSSKLSKMKLCDEVCFFDVPLSLKFSTLDDLVRLSDELLKHDNGIEVVVKRVERLAFEVEPNAELRIIWQRNSLSIDDYLKRFSWDNAKYPKDRAIKENLISVVSTVHKLDEALRLKSSKFNELNHAANNLFGKEGNSLFNKELLDVLTPDVIKDGDFIFSEKLCTIVVVLAKNDVDRFLNMYEFMHEKVVPKSAYCFNGISDADGNTIWRVVLFKDSVHAFQSACKANRFIVRDDFHYSVQKYYNVIDQRSKLSKEVKKQESFLKRLCLATFSDVFISWIHIKVMRCFVEAVLRGGVPPRFSSFLIQVPNQSKVPKLRSELDVLLKQYGIFGKTYDSHMSTGQDGDDEDWLPYVLLPFTPLNATVQ